MTLKPTTAGRRARDLCLLLGSLAIAALAGCASFDGRGLVPGQSRAADVESLMGPPAEKISASGESVWFYPRMPFGRQSFAVRIGPDGVVRAVEQRLTVENAQKLVPGTTTAAAARELLGPPWRVSHLDRQQREVWEYTLYGATQDDFNLYVQLSGGVVREVLMLKEFVKEPTGM